MSILDILDTPRGRGGRGGDGSSHSIHKAKEVGAKAQQGSVSIMQGDGFASEAGGIMEVSMWLCASLLIGL